MVLQIYCVFTSAIKVYLVFVCWKKLAILLQSFLTEIWFLNPFRVIVVTTKDELFIADVNAPLFHVIRAFAKMNVLSFASFIDISLYLFCVS